MSWIEAVVTKVAEDTPDGAAFWLLSVGLLVVAYKALDLAAHAIRRKDKRDE